MPIPLITSTHMYGYLLYIHYTHVTRSVSSHNVRTVAPCYRELLALLAIPTGSLTMIVEAIKIYNSLFYIGNP